jgi:hypothetical protein
MARQALRFTKEVTPGTYPPSPAAGTFTNLRMTTPVTDQPKPIMWLIRDASGTNRRIQTGSAQNVTHVQITTPLYFSQALLLLTPFCTPIAPGATSRGLTSFTLDKFLTLDHSATKAYTRLLGCAPQKLVLNATNSGQGILLTAAMTWIASDWNHTITSTDFADPALNAYPQDSPANLTQMVGLVTINGVAASGFKSFSLTVDNTIDEVYDELHNPIPMNYGGRDVDWMLDLGYAANTFRNNYEAVVAGTTSFSLTDGTTTLLWNLEAVNYISGLDDELPLDKKFYQKISGGAHLDVAAGTDMAYSVTP